MVRGIVIPAVPFLPLEVREFCGLTDYQDAVGGFIEPVYLSDQQLTIYINEDGKALPKPLNERATALWWLLVPAARGRDVIVGEAVLTPEESDRPSPLLDQLLSEACFRVEIQLREAPDDWVQGPRDFENWFEAAKFALLLDQKFGFVAAVRVAPSL